MSSMFKKKGGPAFKPKIPSARPRPAAPAPSKPIELEPVPSTAAEASVSDQPKASSTKSSNESTPDVGTRAYTNRAQESTKSHDAETRKPNHQLDESPIVDEPSLDVRSEKPIESEPKRRLSVTRKLRARRQSMESGTVSETRQNVEPLPAARPSQPPAPEDQTKSLLEAEQSSSSETASQQLPTEPTHPTTQPQFLPQSEQSTPEEAVPESDSAVIASSSRRKAPVKKRERAPGAETKKRKSRARSDKDGQPVKRRARSLTPPDAETQVVDLQKLKMGDLTRDLHIGKKFSRHDELRERERLARIKSRQGKNGEQDDEESESPGSQPQKREGSQSSQGQAPGGGPQFRIVDGQIVIDQKSLLMDRHARAAAARAGQEMETIEENDFTRLITSSSFLNNSKLRGPNIWTPEETELFYRGLRMFGTEFEMISKMFPGKQRRHVKLKFNREERHNPERIDAALIGEKTIKIDIEEYKSFTGTEFHPVETIESEQRRIEEDYEAERKRIADEQAEVMRKKREELFKDDDDAVNGKKKGKKKGKQVVEYGLNGEPIATGS